MKPEACVRTCAFTREKLSPRTALRFAVSPDGKLAFDPAEKLPGRGVWLKADREVALSALDGKALLKAARGRCNRVDTLECVTASLRRHLVSLVGLAAKAWLATFGRDEMRGREFALIIDAADFPLSAEELGAALGRDKSGHIGLAPSALTDKIEAAASKLRGLEKEI